MRVMGLRLETLLDTSVNAIPLGMLVLFMAVFVFGDPWSLGGLSMVVSQALLVVPAVILLLVTSIGAWKIQTDRDEA